MTQVAAMPEVQEWTAVENEARKATPYGMSPAAPGWNKRRALRALRGAVVMLHGNRGDIGEYRILAVEKYWVRFDLIDTDSAFDCGDQMLRMDRIECVVIEDAKVVLVVSDRNRR